MLRHQPCYVLPVAHVSNANEWIADIPCFSNTELVDRLEWGHAVADEDQMRGVEL